LINITIETAERQGVTPLRAHELVQLKALPLFSEMTPEGLESLLDAALVQQFPAGVMLIHEGAQADFLHVLLEGLVEIFSERNGIESGISFIKPVSTFILAAVVSDRPYLNSARTLVASRILLIPAPRVRAAFDRDVAFARIVAMELALAYRGSIKKLKGLMTRSSAERLANWILSEICQKSDHGNIVIPFDRGTLAYHIGTTRENLSRNFSSLAEQGVRVRGRELVIEDMEKLRAFARPQKLIDDPTS
jgi:CRP/FNR family transcriptional activator FtrB